MDAVDVLVKARAIIAAQGGWCAYKRGTDENGHWVAGYNPRAVSHCALGAIDAALGRDCLSPKHPAVFALAKAMKPNGTWESIANFSNEKGQKATVSAFDRAIATERAKRSTEKLIATALHSPSSEPTPVYTVERVW